MTKPAFIIRTTAVAVGAAYSLSLYASGVHIQAGWKQALSYVPAALTLLVTVWDLGLWRQPLFHKISRRPLVAGTWRTQLRPTAESHIPPGGNRGPIEAYIVITQTYWSLSVRQYTAESHSDSKATVWTKDSISPNIALAFTYGNTPKHEHEHRSKAHSGTTLLDVVGMKPTTITGYYFTDRYTKGDMNLTLFDRSSDHADFASVKAHCDRP